MGFGVPGQATAEYSPRVSQTPQVAVQDHHKLYRSSKSPLSR